MLRVRHPHVPVLKARMRLLHLLSKEYICIFIHQFSITASWDHWGCWSRSQLSLDDGQFHSGQVASSSHGHIKRQTTVHTPDAPLLSAGQSRREKRQTPLMKASVPGESNPQPPSEACSANRCVAPIMKLGPTI